MVSKQTSINYLQLEEESGENTGNIKRNCKNCIQNIDASRALKHTLFLYLSKTVKKRTVSLYTFYFLCVFILFIKPWVYHKQYILRDVS